MGLAILAAVEPAKGQEAGSWSKAVVAGGDLATEIAKLKTTSDKQIIAHGGARLARSLVAAGLVDQFVLAVMPAAHGKGLPLFSDPPAPIRLALISTRTFPRAAIPQIYRPA